MHPFRVIPVLDLKEGAVVHGVAGQRHEYAPFVTPLSSSSAPLDIARAFRQTFGLLELYVADLDAITKRTPALATYHQLHDAGCRVWVDAGIRNAAGAEAIAASGVSRLVIGLETVEGPSVIQELCRVYGSERVVFSLDLKAGKPLGDLSRWRGRDAWSIVTEAVACGVGAVIVLDLVRVGTGTGTGADDLCRHLATSYPNIEVVTGGGIRDQQDLLRLRDIGVSAALVATALHHGGLTRQDIEEVTKIR
jgi:phosphoribosylformimino-5-aminoimidazole carboxamide ribotide isomerase